jgi:hypothetical protein
MDLGREKMIERSHVRKCALDTITILIKLRASAAIGDSLSRVLLDPPTIPDLHSRDVRAPHSESKDLAGIGMPSVSIANSEADVERILDEQQEVQEPHGVNFGMEMFRSVHVRRHETPPDPLSKFNWISRFASHGSWQIRIQQSIAESREICSRSDSCRAEGATEWRRK